MPEKFMKTAISVQVSGLDFRHRMTPGLRVIRLVVSAGAVALVTLALLQLREVNPTTVALSYVIAILLIATAWGIGESTLASIAAVFCFNFFFLPPVGTLTVADPQNWVALVGVPADGGRHEPAVGLGQTADDRSRSTPTRSRAAVRAQPGAPALGGSRAAARDDRSAHRGNVSASGRRGVRPSERSRRPRGRRGFARHRRSSSRCGASGGARYAAPADSSSHRSRLAVHRLALWR